MRRRGASFVVALAVLSGLVAVLAVGAEASRVHFRERLNRIETNRSRIAAEAGIQRAIQVLSTQAATPTTTSDDWYSLGNLGADEFKVDSISFRLQIVDDSALINLNSAPEAQLQKLPLTQEQVDSLLDWREAGTNSRTDGGKDEYYNGLPNPYNAKLGNLSSFDELMLIKGFSPTAIYEVQDVSTSTPLSSSGTPILYDICTVDSQARAVTSAGQAKTDINTATAQQLIGAGISAGTAQRIVNGQRPYSGMGPVLRQVQTVAQNPAANRDARNLLDNFRVGGATQTGRINLNTAPEAVLNSIPELTTDVVSSILTQQASGLQNLSDLLSIPGLNVNTVANFVDRISVNSSRFRIRVVGKAGDTEYPIEAVVDTSSTAPRIVKIYQPPFSDMTQRWGWSAVSNTISLGGR